MKILILGANGRSGRRIVNEALRAGFSVHALVRNKKDLPEHQNLRIIEGSCLKRSDLDKALTGTVAVVSALNVSRKSDFPWSKLKSPTDLMSKTMEYLIPLLYAHGISRLLIISAAGTGDSRKVLPKWFAWLIDHSNIKYAYQDHERQEKLVRNSDLEWTILRPVGLSNSSKITRVCISKDGIPPPSMLISRDTLANYVIQTLEDNLHYQESPVISAC